MKIRTLLFVPVVVVAGVAAYLPGHIHENAMKLQNSVASLTNVHDDTATQLNSLNLELMKQSAQFHHLIEQTDLASDPSELYKSGIRHIDAVRATSGDVIKSLRKLIIKHNIPAEDVDKYSAVLSAFSGNMVRALEHTLFLESRSSEVIAEFDRSQINLAEEADLFLAKLRKRRSDETKYLREQAHHDHQMYENITLFLAAGLVLFLLLITQYIVKRLRFLMQRLDTLSQSNGGLSINNFVSTQEPRRHWNEFDRLEETVEQLSKAFVLVREQGRRLEELSVSPIFSVDANGLVDEWNSAAETITGFGRAEVLGRDLVAELTLEDCRGSLREVLDEALAGKQTNGYELQFPTKSAARVHLVVNSNTRRDAYGNIVGVLCVGQDITELRQTQAQVIQASKLATLGEMATSVAHELNQPLTVIRMASNNCRQFVQHQADRSQYVLEKLERIEAQTERAAAIIEHMRMFGRRANEEPAPIDPSICVSAALELVKNQLEAVDICLVTHCPSECPKIVGHPVQLEQVVLNLVLNARDALAGYEANTKQIWFSLEDNGGSVKITCEDNGPGIPPDALDRVFEPFFTTKPMGKGTGLGLSVSYGIIRDMNGRIQADNVAGGARFTIMLPAAELPRPN